MAETIVANDANGARAEILQSIRSRLAESAQLTGEMSSSVAPSDDEFTTVPVIPDTKSLVEVFKQRLESVGGHCAVVDSEAQVFSELKEVLAELRSRGIETRRVACSDAVILGSVAQDLAAEGREVVVLPPTSDLFQCDVGITTAQAAIAETGTLVLEQAAERHRLVSLLPPVHIAIVNAQGICANLGEAILLARVACETSGAITFITGPSRTADIELTLTTGVHGPKELYVIVYEGGH